MAYRLIGKDMVVRITLGGPVDGVPNWGSPVVESLLAKSVSVDESAKKVDTTSNGDDFERFRIQRTDSDKFKLELVVTSDVGAQFQGGRGYYCKVEYKESSSFASYRPPIIGAIMTWSLSGPEGAQVETITVESGAEGAV